MSPLIVSFLSLCVGSIIMTLHPAEIIISILFLYKSALVLSVTQGAELSKIR